MRHIYIWRVDESVFMLELHAHVMNESMEGWRRKNKYKGEEKVQRWWFVLALKLG